jgi:hypothetical protein
MQVVSLDTSLNSTAAVVYSNKIFTFLSFRKELDKDNIWNQSMSFIDMYDVQYQKTETFAESEILKLEDYVGLSSKVYSTIFKLLNNNEKTLVMMEGYSQSSKAGRDHDLVAYGTLIRLKFYSNLNNLIILPPMSLKKYSAQLTYPKSAIGKNPIYRNTEGIAGGKFTKFEMMQALIDYNNNDILTIWCKQNWSDIKKRAGIPAPANDVVDAMWLNLVGQKFFYHKILS